MRKKKDLYRITLLTLIAGSAVLPVARQKRVGVSLAKKQLPARLMVGLRSLEANIGVRIPGWQQIQSERILVMRSLCIYYVWKGIRTELLRPA